MDRITIEFVNWEKFNPKSYKRPTWLALSNDLLDHPDLADFSPIEFHALIYIFCQVSKRNGGNVDIVFAHAEKRNIESALIKRVIEKLELVRMVKIINTPFRQNKASTDIQTDIQTDIPASEEKNLKPKQPEFDFEIIYADYPRKIGRSEAFSRLAKMIQTQSDFEALHLAVKEYRRQCVFQRADEKYIKHFTTFIGVPGKEVWRDYIPARSPIKAPSDPVAAKQDHVEHQEIDRTPGVAEAAIAQITSIFKNSSKVPGGA